MSDTDQASSTESYGKNAWAFMTKQTVTWRQAGDGSVVLTVMAAVGIVVVLLGVWGRRRVRD
jgi:hypothetical protein